MRKENTIIWERLVKFIMGIFLAVMGTCFCYAVQTGDSKIIVFEAWLVQATPCAINDAQPITVSFGNVGISKIDSGRYVQDLHYTLNCGGITNKDKVSILIKATPTNWDRKAITTSVGGLGVQVLKDSSPLELNTYLEIPNPASPPPLQVRLVKKPDSVLSEQPFTATGTIIVVYI
ncbi:fimbrial protein [Enterobacter quasiroggenkampii]|uniref:fimbrial protein n=1 Tax=Enterobacter quasiroggenkampii TaxID=2497436 RepID=UPI0021CDED92|nr:fimbrial protein [Enterobacter quasiroggenkampii]MCU6278388.1 fimbrial protein [Enterobacter quasiroggenkampii]